MSIRKRLPAAASAALILASALAVPASAVLYDPRSVWSYEHITPDDTLPAQLICRQIGYMVSTVPIVYDHSQFRLTEIDVSYYGDRERYTVNYDSAGRVTQINNYWTDYDGSVHSEPISYWYDEYGRLARDSEGNEYDYDSQGRLSSVYYYDDSYFWSEEYGYDRQGRLNLWRDESFSHTIEYGSDGTVYIGGDETTTTVAGRSNIYRDAQGRFIGSWTQYYGEGGEETTVTTAYNAAGLPVSGRAVYSNPYDGEYGYVTEQCSYDAAGNVTRIDTRSDFGDFVEVGSLEFTYSPTASGITVAVNGSPVRWTDAAPFIDINGRTQVPLRAVAGAMGLDVNWNGTKKEAVFSDGARSIRFTIGSTTAVTSEGKLSMDAAPTIVDSRTYAPVRFLAEYFGYSVEWSSASRTVSLTK